MTISYKWLSRHLPETIAPERLSKILTSIGLEVESMHNYSSIAGGLKGLVVGEVLTCDKHPGADKLKTTTVNAGTGEILQIVCGAANVAQGQKVVVALVGTVLHPTGGEPFTIKKAKIRGEESMGMLCAEDEIGLSQDHGGIMVLSDNIQIGTPLTELYNSYEDILYEIGLTPNRMDAMSHMGVARDVLAYLNHHDKANLQLKKNDSAPATTTETSEKIKINIIATDACKRYSGVSLKNIQVKESPQWLKDLLLAIGLQPINNIVDATNFMLHDTGQPLHAFDADKINGQEIKVEMLPAGTNYITLEGKLRILKGNEIMICDGTDAPLCMAGIYGGQNSGVTPGTSNVFLESAWFDPSTIRIASLAHGLRTDAAARFEKGVDISRTMSVLQQAVALLQEIAGAEICSPFTDVYPEAVTANEIVLKFHYLKKLSGKNYHGDTVKKILTSLGFVIQKDAVDALTVIPPLSKPDITLPADIVEEIMRIDGLDNIDIPEVISIAPSVNTINAADQLKEKIATSLTGMGFSEIFTNSITDSKYYGKEKNEAHVYMLNNLSADLDVLRPQMLQTGLEVVAYNLNRKNNDLRLYEMGKTYHQTEGKYQERKHISLYLCGQVAEKGWAQKEKAADFYDLKAVCNRMLELSGLKGFQYVRHKQEAFSSAAAIQIGDKIIATLGEINKTILQNFGIKETVFYADLDWDAILNLQPEANIKYAPMSKFPVVQRDLALLVDSKVSFGEMENAIKATNVPALCNMKLFDIFESDKLGPGKKSLAINFTFSDSTKTLEDQDIDAMMQRLLKSLEKATGAELRK